MDPISWCRDTMIPSNPAELDQVSLFVTVLWKTPYSLIFSPDIRLTLLMSDAGSFGFGFGLANILAVDYIEQLWEKRQGVDKCDSCFLLLPLSVRYVSWTVVKLTTQWWNRSVRSHAQSTQMFVGVVIEAKNPKVRCTHGGDGIIGFHRLLNKWFASLSAYERKYTTWGNSCIDFINQM